MSKRPLVLFSGGLDSTFLLYKTLQEEPCDVLYTDGGQHPLKIEQERKARVKLIEVLNEICPHKVQTDFSVSTNVDFSRTPSLRYSQPMAWICAALNTIDPTIHSELRIGYVYDDGGFCRWLPDIETVWLKSQLFTKWADPVPVTFPLIDWCKVDILDAIDYRLIEHVWVCEYPVNEQVSPAVVEGDGVVDDTVTTALSLPKEPEYTGRVIACLKCGPCRKAAASLTEFKLKHGYSLWTRILKERRKAIAFYTPKPPTEFREGFSKKYVEVESDINTRTNK